jgi:MFS family permease
MSMNDPSERWYSAVTRQQWKTLFAAQLGWMLDALDVMLYAFAFDAIRAEFALSSAQAGALASATLITSAAGGILVGFFGHGYFSVFGALLAELFPTHFRGTAQGLTYNVGRALSAAAPLTVGVLTDRHGMGSALTLTAGFFLAGAALMRMLPETKGQQLEG